MPGAVLQSCRISNSARILLLGSEQDFSSMFSSQSECSTIAPSSLKRFDNDQRYHGEQDQHRQFVEPAVPYMAVPISVVQEFVQQSSAIEMIGDQDCHQHQ